MQVDKSNMELSFETCKFLKLEAAHADYDWSDVLAVLRHSNPNLHFYGKSESQRRFDIYNRPIL